MHTPESLLAELRAAADAGDPEAAAFLPMFAVWALLHPLQAAAGPAPPAG